MSFLRTQNIKRDDNGNIISGSASIMNTVYDNSRQHKSKQVVVEKLGKVLWLGDSGRSGIFLNPQRGLFFYDSYTDKFTPVSADDPRLPHSVEVTPEFEKSGLHSPTERNFSNKTGLSACDLPPCAQVPKRWFAYPCR